MMTREEFLDLLSQTPRDWRLSAGRIRRGSGADPDCPLTAVARQATLAHDSSARTSKSTTAALPLAPDLVDAILAASDNLDQADPSLRMSLLEACGLLIRRQGGTLKLAGQPSGR